MTKYEAPRAPYVEALHRGGKQKPTAIILRPSFTNSREGAALAVAQYWHKSASFWDAGHYTVDETKRFRCVRDNVVAGLTKTDKGAIRIAVCADPVSGTTFWDRAEHGAVLRKTAELVAELILVHKIKLRYLSPKEQARWHKYPTRRRGGIIVMEESGWPADEFLAEVKTQIVLKTHI